MSDKIKQILEAAELLRKGDVATGMRKIAAASEKQVALTEAPPAAKRPREADELATVMELLAPTPPGAPAACGSAQTKPSGGRFDDEGRIAALGIDPKRLHMAQVVGSVRLRMIQEHIQQRYVEAYTQQLLEQQQAAQRFHEQQQEAAQLALIMEAANAQAELAKQSLADDQAELHWHRRFGRQQESCQHWKRGYCGRGDKCSFSHPEKEKGLLQPRGPADIMRHNFKTTLCKNFAAGSCPQGDKCMFAHGPKELRSPGHPLSKDEAETVNRVAIAKIMPKPNPATVAPPAPVLPPGPIAGPLAGQLAGQLSGPLGGPLANANPLLALQGLLSGLAGAVGAAT
mmetsp:Transcript_56531/g.157551  ORF Transcript_56531/g.157551 Transcript_56531/m.157551 type:complete len:343 (+) Transcript_56531:166-1194(+)|eukprot:CAMPEP_0117516340 /NCGR_PEP_ID=MMETSP0784-20121206/31044_1 /TAXON_ID=39447 /ORGANISM="" /LENGTH=342 /DNA_ID=CAMNT_0005312183 /DNA_START=100 /DNA_END=1128 /DNA_ORIENTATION=-